MFKRLREERYIARNVKVSVDELLLQMRAIRNHSDILALCPENTGFDWLGIKRATMNLFPVSGFVFPQYFSRSVYSGQELEHIADGIAGLGFRQVIFNGFLKYFGIMIRRLNQANPEISVKCIFHGSLSEMDLNAELPEDMQLLISMLHSGSMKTIGLIKKGLGEFFRFNYHVNACHIVLPPPIFGKDVNPRKANDGKIHIGVFVNDQFRKNLFNQVAAALMIENSVVHVFETSVLDIFGMNHRFVMHPANLPRDQFLTVLADMDVNLYNTYSETWGQIVVESIVLGIPCLTNNSSGVLDASPGLRNLLVVKEHDNAGAYAEAIVNVLNKKSWFEELTLGYIDALRQQSEASLTTFLNNNAE